MVFRNEKELLTSGCKRIKTEKIRESSISYIILKYIILTKKIISSKSCKQTREFECEQNRKWASISLSATTQKSHHQFHLKTSVKIWKQVTFEQEKQATDLWSNNTYLQFYWKWIHVCESRIHCTYMQSWGNWTCQSLKFLNKSKTQAWRLRLWT